MRPPSASVEKMAMMNKLKQQQREQYERKKTAITGVKKMGGAGGMGTQQLTLEDMNLDRKADFEGDAFDPFKINQSASQYNLQLQAQRAYMDKANSKGGQIWTPEQL